MIVRLIKSYIMLSVPGISRQTQPLVKFCVTRSSVVLGQGQGQGLHTSTVSESRIKRAHRHKPMWHIKKLNKAIDEPMTKENKLFIQEVINEQYSGLNALKAINYTMDVFSFRSIKV